MLNLLASLPIRQLVVQTETLAPGLLRDIN